jgi:hypothetical protein
MEKIEKTPARSTRKRVTMKRIPSHLVVGLALVTIFLCRPPSMGAVEASPPEVAVAAVCRDVVDHEPVDAGISFPATVGKLYCFTKITAARSPTHIAHVWYFGPTERARVELPVNGTSWRTYSSKIIQAHEIGSWHVEVVAASGTVLKELQFEITR